MTDREDSTSGTSRRTVLLGAGAIGVGALAGCGSSALPADDEGGGGPVAAKQPIKVSDIHVGSGMIYPDQVVVVTQPVAGQFRAFSAMCMHLGCVVTKIDNGKIICPCHGSEYNIADGTVALGPSTTPLTRRTATVTGDTITVT
jgi:Rieske Fe-S protein